MSAAKAWRAEAIAALRAGTLRPRSSVTLAVAAEQWLEGARRGTVLNRKGHPYKPSTLRSYERALRLRVLPRFGHRRIDDIRRQDVQVFVDELIAEGFDPSTIQNTLNPLQAIFRRAVSRDLVATNPMRALDLPRTARRRDRIASPTEAAMLLDSLPLGDRAIWASAMYAGLRRGELRALRWEDLDLARGVVAVTRNWDDTDGEIAVKTAAAERTVPIASALRDHLLAHKLFTDRDSGLVFGVTSTRPFVPSTVRRRALAAWRSAGLDPIGLHEARHTFASLMIAAGVNAKALCTYMGHASVSITFDRYGHLMPGNEEEAAGLLDDYLARAAQPHEAVSPLSAGPASRTPEILVEDRAEGVGAGPPARS